MRFGQQQRARISQTLSRWPGRAPPRGPCFTGAAGISCREVSSSPSPVLQAEGHAVRPASARDDLRAKFVSVFGGHASQVEVSPLKRPFLEGSFSVSIADNVIATLVSNVEGTDVPAIVDKVRTRALALAQRMLTDTRTPSSKPLHFLRQQIVLRHCDVLEQARALDLELRFVFGEEHRAQTDRALPAVSTSPQCSPPAPSGLTSVSLRIMDPWVAFPDETTVGRTTREKGDELEATSADISSRVEETMNYFLEEVRRRQTVNCREEAAEAHLRLREALEGSFENTLDELLLGDYGGAINCTPAECDLQTLSHVETGQGLVFGLTVRDEWENETRIRHPMIAVEDAHHLVYAQHDTLPMTTLERLAELEEAGEVAPGYASRSGLSMLELAVDIALTHDFLIFRNFLREAAGPLRRGVPVEAFVRCSGRAEVNEWATAQRCSSGSRSALVHGELLPPLLPLPDSADRKERGGSPLDERGAAQLRQVIVYEVGACHLPFVCLPERKVSHGSCTPGDDSQPVALFLPLHFRSACAVAADSGCCLTVGQRFEDVETAVRAVCPCLREGADERAVVGTEGGAVAVASQRNGSTYSLSARGSPSRSVDAKAPRPRETQLQLVEVLDVERTLKNHGVATCQFHAGRSELTCLDEKGQVVFQFHHLNSLSGLDTLFRVVSRDTAVVAYSPATVSTDYSPETNMRSVLRIMLSNTRSQKVPKLAPYMKGQRLPVPLENSFTLVAFGSPLERAYTVSRLLAMAQRHARHPAQWPLPPQPSVSFFALWPLTRTVLARLRESVEDFTFHIRSDKRSEPQRQQTEPARAASYTPRAWPPCELDQDAEVVYSFSSQQCSVTGRPSDASTASRTVSKRFRLRAGPEFLKDFYDSLTAMLASEELANRLALHRSSTSEETRSADDSSSDTSAKVALPIWESLGHYAVPSKVSSAHSRTAYRAVVDNLFKSNQRYERDEENMQYVLTLAIDPQFTVRLATVAMSEVTDTDLWKEFVAYRYLTKSMTAAVGAAVVIQDVADVLYSLEVSSMTARVSVAPTVGSTPDVIVHGRHARRFECRFDHDVGDRPCTAAVHTNSLTDALPSTASLSSGVPLSDLQSTGMTRLECLLALLPKLRRFAEIQLSLSATERVVSPGDDGKARDELENVGSGAPQQPTTDRRVSVVMRLARTVATEGNYSEVFHEYSVANRELRIRARKRPGSEQLVELASVMCEWNDIPRYLVYLYRHARLVCQGTAAPDAQFTPTEDSNEKVSTLRERVKSFSLLQISEMVEKAIPCGAHYRDSVTVSEVGCRRERFWAATLPLPVSLLSVGGSERYVGPHSDVFELRCVLKTKAAASRSCLSTILLWMMHGIPVVPEVDAAYARAVVREQFLSKRNASSTDRPPPQRSPCRAILTHPLDPQPPEAHRGVAFAEPDGTAEYGSSGSPRRSVPRRVTRRVTLRPEFGADAKSDARVPPEENDAAAQSATTGPTTTDSLAPPEAVPLLQHLQHRVELSIHRTTNLSGHVRVVLSHVFGVRVMFSVAVNDGGAGLQSPVRTGQGITTPRRVNRRSGKPLRVTLTDASSLAAPSANPGKLESAAAPPEEAPLLTAGWSSSAGAPWVPLQVLRCLFAVAERTQSSSDDVCPLQSFSHHDLMDRVPFTSARGLCEHFFRHYCGWEVSERRRVEAAKSRVSSVAGQPLKERSRTHLTFIELTTHTTPGLSVARRQQRDERFSPATTAKIILVQRGSTTLGATHVFARPLAQCAAPTESDAVNAVWEQCAQCLLSTLGLPLTAGKLPSEAVLRTCVERWLRDTQ